MAFDPHRKMFYPWFVCVNVLQRGSRCTYVRLIKQQHIIQYLEVENPGKEETLFNNHIKVSP